MRKRKEKGFCCVYRSIQAPALGPAGLPYLLKKVLIKAKLEHRKPPAGKKHRKVLTDEIGMFWVERELQAQYKIILNRFYDKSLVKPNQISSWDKVYILILMLFQ